MPIVGSGLHSESELYEGKFWTLGSDFVAFSTTIFVSDTSLTGEAPKKTIRPQMLEVAALTLIQ